MSTNGSIAISLPIMPPFSASHLFERYVQVSNRQRLVRVSPELRRLTRAIRVQDTVVPVTVQFEGTVEAPAALVLVPEGTPGTIVDGAVRAVAHMIGAEVNLGAFYRTFAVDEHFSVLTERLRGSKLLLDPDPFECLVKTIISQQLNLSFAGTLIERLTVHAGYELTFEGEPLLVFPDAESVARLSPESLRTLSFSQRKAEYVIDAARAVVDGTIDWTQVECWSDEEAIQELSRLRGIGRWTVECLLLFAYGRPDLLPASDIGLRNGVKKVYGLAEQPSTAYVAALGANWSPWRTYATYYLWESLRLP
jgi:DNA-3-methyladenine glycosylase II